jgi:hypothetical protein
MLPPETRLNRIVQDSRFRQPPEEVAPEQTLRKRALARPDREHDLVRRREFLRDLEAGVPAADDEDGPRWHLVRPAIADRVRLEDLRGEPFGDLRHVRRLEGAGRGYDLVSGDRPSIELEAEAPVFSSFERLDLAAEVDRQLKGLGVALEIGDHLIPRRVAVRIPGEGESRQPAVAARREQGERLPALAPGRGDLSSGFENHEAAALASEEVPDRKPCLASAHDGDVKAPSSTLARVGGECFAQGHLV